jgi:hypothetical protein
LADRLLMDTTKFSKRLASLSPEAFGLFPYIFQETDAYGCLELDSDVVKWHRFPKVDWVTPDKIESAIQEFKNAGMLFIWSFDGHRFGFFVGWEAKSGKYLSRRGKRTIPEPPADELAKFLNDNNRFKSLQGLQITSNGFKDCKSLQITSRATNHFEDCKSLPLKERKGEGGGKKEVLVSKDKSLETAEPPQKSSTSPEKPKNSFEEVQQKWKEAWEEEITFKQIGRLLQAGYCFQGGDRNCGVILQFIQEHKHNKMENPYGYAIELSKSKQTLEILKSRTYKNMKVDRQRIGQIFEDMGAKIKAPDL